MPDPERPQSSPAASNMAADMAGSGAAVRIASQRLSPPERLALLLPPRYCLTIAGGLAGAASGIVSCPLDVIKTKLQAQGGFRVVRRYSTEPGVASASGVYRGVKGTARMIWVEEGIRGMYRGLGPMLLGYIPTWAVYMTIYNSSQSYFRRKTENNFVANMYASLVGGTCSTLVTNPIWVIKTRLMAQSPSHRYQNSRAPWQYRNTIDAARKMYMHEGLLSFYSGLTPALLGLTHVAIQFPMYEVFKVKFTGLGKNTSEQDQDNHFFGLAAAVFLSKVVASTATYPHEVVRTRLQTQQRSLPYSASDAASSRGTNRNQGRPPGGASSDGMINRPRYRGTWQTCNMILYEEGWRGFYAGLGTNLLRAVPSAMTTILTFEYLKKAFFDWRESGAAKMEHDADPRGLVS